MLELHALFASKRPRPNLVTETENVAADNIHVSFTHKKKKKNIYIYTYTSDCVSQTKHVQNCFLLLPSDRTRTKKSLTEETSLK